MKSKFLIGVLTVVAGIFFCILILNLSNSVTNKTYYFERKFSENEILKFDRQYKCILSGNNNDLSFSNKAIIEGKIVELDNSQKISLYITNFKFDNIFSKFLELPIEAVVFYVDDKTIIYSLDNKLYSLGLKNDFKYVIESKNIKITFMIKIDKLSNKYLFFGEIFENNIYKNGFFVLDFSNNKVTQSKVIHSNNISFKPEINLMNSGLFQKLNDSFFAYTCDKNSKIYLFDEFGNFLKIMNTKDETPSPKVIKNDNGDCFYSRDGLRFSNSGVFLYDDYLFVFSVASDVKNNIIIDQYSKNNEYMQTYKLKYKNYSSVDISNVYIDKKYIILRFGHNYASFKFSRYL